MQQNPRLKILSVPLVFTLAFLLFLSSSPGVFAAASHPPAQYSYAAVVTASVKNEAVYAGIEETANKNKSLSYLTSRLDAANALGAPDAVSKSSSFNSSILALRAYASVSFGFRDAYGQTVRVANADAYTGNNLPDLSLVEVSPSPSTTKWHVEAVEVILLDVTYTDGKTGSSRSIGTVFNEYGAQYYETSATKLRQKTVRDDDGFVYTDIYFPSFIKNCGGIKLVDVSEKYNAGTKESGFDAKSSYWYNGYSSMRYAADSYDDGYDLDAIYAFSTVVPERPMRTANEIASEIGAGWNLGNMLEGVNGTDYEEEHDYGANLTAIWNPISEEDLRRTLADVKAQGFQAVRLPVTWYNHTDGNWRIYPEWLEYVRSVVDIVLEEDLYCVVDMHHDGYRRTGSNTLAAGWLFVDPADAKKNEGILNTLWTQIASHFASYGDHLLFEGFNEIHQRLDKTVSAAEAARIVQGYNQAFVDAVRAAGGKNAQRVLVVKQYAGSLHTYLSDPEDGSYTVLLPDDTGDRLILSLHDYNPGAFTENASSYTEQTEKEIGWSFDFLREIEGQLNNQGRTGVPVFIGEFGAKLKSGGVNRDYESLKSYYTCFMLELQQTQYTPFLWDDNGGFGLYDRTSHTWAYQEIVDIITP